MDEIKTVEWLEGLIDKVKPDVIYELGKEGGFPRRFFLFTRAADHVWALLLVVGKRGGLEVQEFIIDPRKRIVADRLIRAQRHKNRSEPFGEEYCTEDTRLQQLKKDMKGCSTEYKEAWIIAYLLEVLASVHEVGEEKLRSRIRYSGSVPFMNTVGYWGSVHEVPGGSPGSGKGGSSIH